MIPKHFSDERLLAWLDGEQNLLAAALTRRHLNSCWECRSRLSRLEAAAQRLAEAQPQSAFLPPERVAAARRRFLNEAARRHETIRSAVWKRGIAYAAASSVCLAAAVGIWETWQPNSRGTAPAQPAAKAMSQPAPASLERPLLPLARTTDVAPHSSRLADRIPAREADAGMADEVLVWSVLHDLGLCRERGVQIRPEGGRLRLTGVMASNGARERLAARLREVGLQVQLELLSVDDIAPSGQPPVPAERVTRVDAPGEELVRQWLSVQGVTGPEAAVRINEIANATVQAADSAWSEAWALRDLAARFGPVWREMQQPAHAIVLSMTRDHWSELQTLAARQRRLIGGILPAVHGKNPDAFSAAEQWTDAAQQLFAPAGPVAESRQLTTGIASALCEIESLGGDDAALTALLQSGNLRLARRR